ncbi:MAG: MBL fold metallo-hydrolase [Candidatus Pacebacteria bacterium]|nr:MBL fold metallo-hydrolase [Candidatus Paceibacterota bacterium]
MALFILSILLYYHELMWKPYFAIMIVILSSIFLYSTLDFDSGYLRIDFLDVGQGDSILVTSPSGKKLLIDAGRDKKVLRSIGKEMSFFDRDIDAILATHPDADHIGGFPYILERFDVSYVLKTLASSNSSVFGLFNRRILEEGATEIVPERGMLIDLGEGVFVDVLFPLKDYVIDSNSGSVIVKVIYKDTSFLLMGDSTVGVEEYLVEIDGYLESDVLKVGHHGSKTSTSEVFLEKVIPEYAVILAGKGNSHGHPHKVVTDLLESKSINILSTADLGTITIFSNGIDVWVD